MTINDIDTLKAQLITRHIAYEDEMCGCSEQEILEIEAKYGKLPLSYRQIISLIGHSAGFLISDTSFYVSTKEDIDQLIYENELYRKYRKEAIENNEVDGDLLEIPENIFIIHGFEDKVFILTNNQENKQDSKVYIYQDMDKLENKCSSVWEWIDRLVKTSFNGDRSNVYPYDLQGYRKSEYKDSGEIIIHKSYENPDIVKQFINSEESRQWYENRKSI